MESLWEISLRSFATFQNYQWHIYTLGKLNTVLVYIENQMEPKKWLARHLIGRVKSGGYFFSNFFSHIREVSFSELELPCVPYSNKVNFSSILTASSPTLPKFSPSHETSIYLLLTPIFAFLFVPFHLFTFTLNVLTVSLHLSPFSLLSHFLFSLFSQVGGVGIFQYISVHHWVIMYVVCSRKPTGLCLMSRRMFPWMQHSRYVCQNPVPYIPTIRMSMKVSTFIKSR